MRKLIVMVEGEFQSNAERFDRHDRNGANGRADGDVNQWVLLSVDWGDPVDHDRRENSHRCTV